MEDHTIDWGVTVYVKSKMRNQLNNNGWRKIFIPTHLRIEILEHKQIFKKKFKGNEYKPGRAINEAENEIKQLLKCNIGIDENCIGKQCIGAISLDNNSTHYFEYLFK